ncbi:MAG: phage minor head protein [Spirochaetaceae bacterium]|nr:phage minor head protein [Spirochaetaceae bacterium]
MPDEHRQLAGPPPRQAIDYLRRKGIRPGFSYLDVWREEHAHAFTIAKMMDLDMLRDVRDSITAAQDAGTTREQWMRQMTEYLSKQGWWGRKVVEDPKTGKKVEAQLGSSRRLETIWRVNIGQAAQAGVWERGQRSTSHPYLLYRVGPSRQHRDQHLAWDGMVLPKDSDFWAVANPRNGWGCKCSTRFVSAAQYRRYQRDGIPAPPVGDASPKKKRIKTDEPVLQPMQYRNRRTGQVHTGYAGIDPGFERNPGVGRMEQLGEVFVAKSTSLAADTVPTGAEVPAALDVRPTGDLRKAITRSLDAIELVHGSGNLPRIPVKRMRTGSDLGQFRSFLNGDAESIRVRGGTNALHPEMTTAHEVGHFLDFAGLPGPTYQSRLGRLPEMKQLLVAIMASATFQTISMLPPSPYRSYLQHPEELFARAYAQYVAWKSGSPIMRDQLDALLQAASKTRRLQQWPHAEFLPIAAALDELFEKMGWLIKR